MQTLRAIEGWLSKIEGGFIVALLSAMAGLTFTQVLLRNLHTYVHMRQALLFLGQIDWAEPLARLTVLWVTFLGASVLTGDNRHIKIDFLSAILPSKWLPLRELIICVATAVVCGFMFKASLDYVSVEYHSGATLFLAIPSWVSQLILPVGFLLLLFKFVVRAAEEIHLLRRGRNR